MRNFYYTCNMYSPSLEIVTRTTYRPAKIFLTSIRVGLGLKLRRKAEGLAYENAENRNPRRTDPWRTYAQFQELNVSPALHRCYSELTSSEIFVTGISDVISYCKCL